MFPRKKLGLGCGSLRKGIYLAWIGPLDPSPPPHRYKLVDDWSLPGAVVHIYQYTGPFRGKTETKESLGCLQGSKLGYIHHGRNSGRDPV